MTDDERELLRLQTLLALWPEARSRDEFGTELSLKRAVEAGYNRVYRDPTAEGLRDVAERLLADRRREPDWDALLEIMAET